MSDPSDSNVLCADAGMAAARPPLAVSIVRAEGEWQGFAGIEASILGAVAALAAHACARGSAAGEAAIVLADDALLRGLNRTYRGKDAATNVLSFPFKAPPGAGEEGCTYLGDVMLAAETVAREAEERRIPPVAHLQHLVVHGLLHLMGYDHEDDGDAQVMERIETEVLASLGIADPHAAGPCEGAGTDVARARTGQPGP
jgi:probable rRNA maturation factor